MVFHGRVPEAYLWYIKICKNLICNKDLITTFEGYWSEEALVKEDIVLHDMNKPDADVSAESVDVASTSGRIPRKKDASTPFEKWTRTKGIFQKKVDNAQKAQNGVLEEVSTTYEHLLGEEVRLPTVDRTRYKSVLHVGLEEREGQRTDRLLLVFVGSS